MNRERFKIVLASLMTLVAFGLIATHYLEISVRVRDSADTEMAPKKTDAILSELREIRGLLEARSARKQASAPRLERRARPTAPQLLTVSIDGSPSLGDPNAPVVMVEFTDYECPFCNRFHKQTFPKIKKTFIDTKKLRYVMRDLPLGFHTNAVKAAQAALCAGEQGNFWGMSDALFAHAKALQEENLPGYAKAIGLDGSRLWECMQSGRHLETIQASAADAARLGIQGTPTFIIGRLTEEGNLLGAKVVGAQPYSTFAKVIEAFRATAN